MSFLAKLFANVSLGEYSPGNYIILNQNISEQWGYKCKNFKKPTKPLKTLVCLNLTFCNK